MIRFGKRLRSQSGQALTIVLALLAIGGLTIAVSLNYATTSLRGSRIVEEKTDGVYAAGAGMEYALWGLRPGGGWTVPDDTTASTTTPDENVNQMAVGIQAQNKGTITLVLTGWSALATNWDRMSISKSITSNESESGYLYTVNVTWHHTSSENVKLIAVKLPLNYSYNGTAGATRSDNETAGDPIGYPDNIPQDSQGAYELTWDWTGPPQNYPDLQGEGDQFTLTFYITGSGSTTGSYALARAVRADVGTVGEMTGTLYKITATATRPQDSKITARIVSDMLMMSGTPYIISWQITQ